MCVELLVSRGLTAKLYLLCKVKFITRLLGHHQWENSDMTRHFLDQPCVSLDSCVVNTIRGLVSTISVHFK